MSSARLTHVVDTFPIGTVVDAYRRDRVAGTGLPSGQPAATATVADDASLTFSGLDLPEWAAYEPAGYDHQWREEYVPYVAHALVAGVPRSISFRARREGSAGGGVPGGGNPGEYLAPGGVWTPLALTAGYGIPFEFEGPARVKASRWIRITRDSTLTLVSLEAVKGPRDAGKLVVRFLHSGVPVASLELVPGGLLRTQAAVSVVFSAGSYFSVDTPSVGVVPAEDLLLQGDFV